MYVDDASHVFARDPPESPHRESRFLSKSGKGFAVLVVGRPVAMLWTTCCEKVMVTDLTCVFLPIGLAFLVVHMYAVVCIASVHGLMMVQHLAGMS